MTLSRRKALAVIGGGTILAAVGAGAFAVSPASPRPRSPPGRRPGATTTCA
jgi:hypothetical protein